MNKESIKKAVNKLVRCSYEYRSLIKWLKVDIEDDLINEIIESNVEAYQFLYGENGEIIGPSICHFEIARRVNDEIAKRIFANMNTSIPEF